jgi:hypothetical protein
MSNSEPNQSININAHGNQVSIGSITQFFNSSHRKEIDFDLFIKIISEKYLSLEQIPQVVVDDIWKLLNTPCATKLQNDETNLLSVLVRYFCFFLNNWDDPLEQKRLSYEYYYSLLKEIKSDPHSRIKCQKVSKIIGQDRKIYMLLSQ